MREKGIRNKNKVISVGEDLKYIRAKYITMLRAKLKTTKDFELRSEIRYAIKVLKRLNTK